MNNRTHNNQQNKIGLNDADEDQISIIGKNFTLTGDIIGPYAAIISGKIEGNISASHVIVNDSAVIHGNISCQKIDISGFVRGAIESNEIAIRHQATVEGDITYGDLTIECGGVTLGRLKRVPLNAKNHLTPKTDNAKATRANDDVHPSRDHIFSRIDLPLFIRKSLRSLDPDIQPYLSLVDGNPIPSWIKLSHDGLALLVDNFQLNLLEEGGKEIPIRLKVGEEFFDLILPMNL